MLLINFYLHKLNFNVVVSSDLYVIKNHAYFTLLQSEGKK